MCVLNAVSWRAVLHNKGFNSIFKQSHRLQHRGFMLSHDIRGSQRCYLKGLLVGGEQLGGLRVELDGSLRVRNHDLSPGLHTVRASTLKKKRSISVF